MGHNLLFRGLWDAVYWFQAFRFTFLCGHTCANVAFNDACHLFWQTVGTADVCTYLGVGEGMGL
jgi:hypothetical protein